MTNGARATRARLASCLAERRWTCATRGASPSRTIPSSSSSTHIMQRLPFRLPRIRNSRAAWELVLDTARESGFVEEKAHYPAHGTVELIERSLVVLRHGLTRHRSQSHTALEIGSPHE